jgi:putative PIN family toxin of toxin-antitoxin system
VSRSAPRLPRTVLDTNVVLSALVFTGGPTARLRHAWQAGLLLPLVSTATAQELIRVLAYPKFGLDAQERQELLADYLPWAEVVAVPEPPPRVPACRDVHDPPFLHLAAAGRADVLVTGDADLLALAAAVTTAKTVKGHGLRCRVLTAQAFLVSLGSGPPFAADGAPLTSRAFPALPRRAASRGR